MFVQKQQRCPAYTSSSSAPTSSSSRAAPTATSSSSRAAPTATSSSSRAAPTATSSSSRAAATSRGRSIATCTSPTTGTSSIDTSAPHHHFACCSPGRCHHHPHGSHGQNQAAVAIEEAGGDIEDKAEQ
eukprot:Em0008g594a